MTRSTFAPRTKKQFNRNSPSLLTLRKSADDLGLDILTFIRVERKDPVRAIIELKTIVGIRISSSENIVELRALSAFWQSLLNLQSMHPLYGQHMNKIRRSQSLRCGVQPISVSKKE